MLSFKDLQSEFDEAKTCVEDAELKIKRFTGRDADQYAVTYDGDIKLKNEGRFPGRGRGFATRKRKLSARNSARIDEVSPEESPYEDDDNPVKRKVQSTIVATGRHAKTRKELIRDQNYDSRGLARNRRMFGFVLGTLRKFEREEDQRVNEKKKREEIDKKLEEAAERDKEKMKEEKEKLFLMRKEQKVKMRCLEKKMEILERHEVWEKSQNYFKNFLTTDAKPSIMFLPKNHNAKTLQMLEEARERRTNSINARRAKVKRELTEIDYWYTRDDKNDENEETEDRDDDKVDKNEEIEDKNENKYEDKDEAEDSICDRDSKDIEVQNIFQIKEHFASEVNLENIKIPEDDCKEQSNDLNRMKDDTDEALIENEEIQMESDSINNRDIINNPLSGTQNTSQEDFEPIYDE